MVMSAVSRSRVLTCPVCGGKGTLQSSEKIWPGRGHPQLYICENYPRCDSYVRCHQDSEIPLGTLAGPKLRKLREVAHKQFDPLWKDNGNVLGRNLAYEVAGGVMEVDGEFHIGNLNEEQCRLFIERIPMIEVEIDRRLEAHLSLEAPTSDLTIDVFYGLFHPDRDTFLRRIDLREALNYEFALNEAKRTGLVVQVGYEIELTPKGKSILFDPTD